MRYGDSFRFNGQHKDHGGKFSVMAAYTRGYSPDPSLSGPDYWLTPDGRRFAVARDGSLRLEYQCSCGSVRYASPVLGKVVASKECSSKCMGSIGHQCECSCGGKNHGASHG